MENPVIQPLKFRATIEDAGSGGAFVRIPLDVEAVFGKKRVKVIAMIDGEPYQGSLVRMGTDCHILGVRKDIREKIGKTCGQEVEITLREDAGVRAVAIPPDLKEAFSAVPEAAAFFGQLAYTHQKEYVQWIEAAKRDQTRQERIAKTVQRLNEQKKVK
jgi:hypothetical protein